MSEGPPNEPKKPAEAIPEQIDTQAVFAHVRGVIAELYALPLSGKETKELGALVLADESLDKGIESVFTRLSRESGEDEKDSYRDGLGELYILYIRALTVVVRDDVIWKIVAEESGTESASLKRQLMQKSLADLESIQMEQFIFDGPKH